MKIWVQRDEQTIIKSLRGLDWKIIHIGALKLVKWNKKTILKLARLRFFKNFNFDFYGIGIFGYYIGFLNARRNKRT